MSPFLKESSLKKKTGQKFVCGVVNGLSNFELWSILQKASNYTIVLNKLKGDSSSLLTLSYDYTPVHLIILILKIINSNNVIIRNRTKI